MLPLREVPEYLRDRKSGRVGARAGEGVGRQCSMRTEFGEDKNSGDGWW